MRAAVVLFLLLTACMPTDPYVMRDAAEAAIKATEVARQVAATGTAGARDVAALQATRYAGELLAVEAQSKGTAEAISASQTAVSMQLTKSVADLQATQAQATSAVIMLQSTAAYQVRRDSLDSTATAMADDRILQATLRANSVQRSNGWRWLGLFLAAGLSVVGIAFLGSLVYGFVILTKAKAYQRRIDADVDYFTATGRAPALLPSGPAPSDNKETIEFLYRAAQIVGKDASQIPSDDRMGMTSRPWSREVHRLVDAGVVYTVNGTGSYIKLPWRTIDGLYTAITLGKLKLPPYPSENQIRFSYRNGNGNENAVVEEEAFA